MDSRSSIQSVIIKKVIKMGWVTLTARKQSLRLAISSYEMREIEISRETRRSHRNYAYDQSIMKNNKQAELLAARESYFEIRDEKPEDRESDEYQDWLEEYNVAKEDYQAEQNDINNMYDSELEMLEQESQEEETLLQEEQTTLESQLEALRSEFDVVKEQISKEIEEAQFQL